MTWAKLDDRMHDDPRTEAAGIEAMGLWAIALSYMADHGTNGVISKERTRRIAGRSGHWLAERLVKAGWWTRTDGAYVLVNWDLFLIPKVPTNLTRKSDEGPSKVERTSVESDHEPPPVHEDVHGIDGPRESRGETPHAGARPVPSRPDPDPKKIPEDPGSQSSPGQRVLFGASEDQGEGKARREPKRPPKLAEVPTSDLTPAERAIADAIAGDESFRLTVPMPNRLARELLRIAPDVDIPRKVAALGAWTRERPANWRPKGHVFLRTCVEKAQAEAPPRPKAPTPEVRKPPGQPPRMVYPPKPPPPPPPEPTDPLDIYAPKGPWTEEEIRDIEERNAARIARVAAERAREAQGLPVE